MSSITILVVSFSTIPRMTMNYTDANQLLKSVFNQSAERVAIPGSSVCMVNCELSSTSRTVLPGAKEYGCDVHSVRFREDPAAGGDQILHPEGLSVPDVEFRSNSEFRYTIFLPADRKKSCNTIFLMHGLNERYWYKYLPWAFKLVELTGSSVCLIPLAFHMNRAPVEWSSVKRMNAVAEDRKRRFPSITGASFANAAISTRLQTIPQRFFWSGVQTYHDVIQVVHQIRRDQHPHIDGRAQINFFAYSIGSFLAQILLMANREDAFTDSKLFIFCGGPTFDRMYPVSKYIIDSEALIALYAFFVEHLNNEFKNDARLAHYFSGGHDSGLYFRAMLSNRKLKELREGRFRELSDQVMAVALKQDEVIQPSEVLNTLKGDFRDIPIPVHIMDFPFEYSHVNPFPLKRAIADDVDRSFNEVFSRAASHLAG